MAKSKKGDDAGADRAKDRHKHKPLQLRLHPLIRQQLKALADENLTNMSQEASAAIKKHLKEAGFWPPPARPA